MATGKKIAAELQNIKDNIHASSMYFEKNADRYNQFMRFIFESTLSDDDLTVLNALGKPELEFNVSEAYISRLCGEFSKMEPGFILTRANSNFPIHPRLIEVLEGYFKAALDYANKNGFSYQMYSSILGGGYGVGRVYTEYENPMSFNQRICFTYEKDPTLCGFDPMAEESHKGDGRFCYKVQPYLEHEAKAIFGNSVGDGLTFTRAQNAYNWSYLNNNQRVILIGEYYRKVPKETKIVLLSNGRTVTEKDYERLTELWNQTRIEQAPRAVKARKTIIEHIDRYIVSENKVLDHTPTNYGHLPFVFFDGNSKIIRDKNAGNASQMTRPYLYNIQDAQRLKNFSGCSAANEIENLVQHKWKAAVEAVPEDYRDAYENVQQASVLMYNAFDPQNPDKALPPPEAIVRPQIPPELMEIFVQSDNLIQNILGSYDASLGITNNALSGVAIMQGAMHSNAASMPYLVGFMQGLNRVAEIVLDLIPKYYVTPMTIPVIRKDGKREFEQINSGRGVSMNYDVNSLGVQVEAGVNFAVQKQISLDTIIKLMQASETFAAFINQKGLPTLLDNIEIRNIEGLKELAQEFMQQQEQQQQMMQQQQAQMPTPQQLLQQQFAIEQSKIQQKAQESENKKEVDMLKIATDDAVKNRQADIDFLEVMSKIESDNLDRELQQEKVDAENARSAVEMAINVSSHNQQIGSQSYKESDNA